MTIHFASNDLGNSTYDVVIGALPEVIVQLVTEAIDRNPQLVLRAVAKDLLGVLEAVTASTDVVLLGAPELYPPPGIVSHLLTEYASLRVLVFSPQRNAGIAYWLQLQRTPIATGGALSVASALVDLCQQNSWPVD